LRVGNQNEFFKSPVCCVVVPHNTVLNLADRRVNLCAALQNGHVTEKIFGKFQSVNELEANEFSPISSPTRFLSIRQSKLVFCL
jgi:hypothetical protein